MVLDYKTHQKIVQVKQTCLETEEPEEVRNKILSYNMCKSSQ